MVQIDATTTAVEALSISLDHDLPVGAGFRAIRSPRSDGRAPSPLIANQDSVGSELGSKATLSPTGSNSSLDIHQHGRPSASNNKDDLAKRAQSRVTERKRTELEKKQEQEKQRLKKQESDKMKKEHDQQLRQRRRAEIYALNAILRQLQQEKMAAYINAHRGSAHAGDAVQQQSAELAVECSEAALVQSIGV